MSEDEATPAPLDLAVVEDGEPELAAEVPTPAQVHAFKEAWHEADRTGQQGHRVEAGLRAAFAVEEDTESNLVAHAENELRLAGLLDSEDDYNGMLGDAALGIVKMFAKQGHSGFSAAVTTEIVEKLLRFQPLTQLTYDEDEWTHVADEMVSEQQRPLYQNRRKPDVFSHDHGKTWYCLDGTEGVRGD